MKSNSSTFSVHKCFSVDKSGGMGDSFSSSINERVLSFTISSTLHGTSSQIERATPRRMNVSAQRLVQIPPDKLRHEDEPVKETSSIPKKQILQFDFRPSQSISIGEEKKMTKLEKHHTSYSEWKRSRSIKKEQIEEDEEERPTQQSKNPPVCNQKPLRATIKREENPSTSSNWAAKSQRSVPLKQNPSKNSLNYSAKTIKETKKPQKTVDVETETVKPLKTSKQMRTTQTPKTQRPSRRPRSELKSTVTQVSQPSQKIKMTKPITIVDKSEEFVEMTPLRNDSTITKDTKTKKNSSIQLVLPSSDDDDDFMITSGYSERARPIKQLEEDEIELINNEYSLESDDSNDEEYAKAEKTLTLSQLGKTTELPSQRVIEHQTPEQQFSRAQRFPQGTFSDLSDTSSDEGVFEPYTDETVTMEEFLALENEAKKNCNTEASYFFTVAP